MLKVQKALLPLLASLAMGAVIASAAEEQTVTLRVDGMYCGACTMTVEIALERLPGVSSAKAVRKPVGQVTVSYDPDKATIQGMMKAIADAGYTAYAPGASGSGGE